MGKRTFIVVILLSAVLIGITLAAWKSSENFDKTSTKVGVSKVIKPTTKEMNEELKNLTRVVLADMTTRNAKMIPTIGKKFESILGKDKFRDLGFGKPISMDIDGKLPKPSELRSSFYIKLIFSTKIPKGYYMDPMISKKKPTEYDKQTLEYVKSFLGGARRLSRAYYSGKISDELIKMKGFLDVANAGLGDLPPIELNIPDYELPVVDNNLWRSALRSPIYRTASGNPGTWDKTIVVNDSEVSILGDDFYGLLSVGDAMTNSARYMLAGYNDRNKLISVHQSSNLGFGRMDIDESQGGPSRHQNSRLCSDSEREYGQGTRISNRYGQVVTLFPIICDGDETILDLRKGMNMEQFRQGYKIIVRDQDGNILNEDGKIAGICNWITYDRISNLLLTPNDYSCEYINLYYVSLGTSALTLTLVKTAYFLGDNFTRMRDSIDIEAACIASDGKLYVVKNEFNSQGILVFTPYIHGSNWVLMKDGFIELDVDDTLVGITEVDDVRYIKTGNVPNLIVNEINEDYFSQDNITLHELVPKDAVVEIGDAAGEFGTESETGNWRDLGDEFSCGLGITIYNIQRNENWTNTTRDTPYTLSHPALVGLKRYLSSFNFNLDVDLDRVEIYDNMCLSANDWNYSDGEDQTTTAMCFGYTIYMRDILIQPDGLVKGHMLNVLMHELAHTRQFVQLGESHYQFGCIYGESVLYSMLESDETYWFTPMEVEARNFTDQHRLDATIASSEGIAVSSSIGSWDPFYDVPTVCGPR